MLKSFSILKQTRTNISNAINGLSLEQLNTIPPGFNNNIFWNVAHVVATQQLLSYGLSGIEATIPNAIIENYRKGTRPNGSVSQEQVDEVLSLLHSTPDQTFQDIQNNVFGNFKTYTTSYGVTLHSLEEAVMFNNVHEGLHLGVVLAMKKVV